MTETRDDVIAATPPNQRAELEALDRAIREAAPSLEATAGGGGLGYGHYWYRYASGREGDWFALSLVPRVGNVALYLGPGGVERWADRLPTRARGAQSSQVPAPTRRSAPWSAFSTAVTSEAKTMTL